MTRKRRIRLFGTQTVRKSQASMLAACWRRNVRHDE
jgi:hypothetical protein